MNRLIIGTDVGTTASKVLIVDEQGSILSESYREYPLIFPAPKHVEQDIRHIRDVYFDAIREAVQRLTPQERERIVALSLSTQRSTMAPLDASGQPLRNAITWMDGRSGAECEEIRRDLGKEAVLRATGLSIATVWSYAFVCWLKKHERDLYDRTACFALVNTYLLHEMGVDEFVTDYSSACESLMFDPMGKRWSPLMLDYLRLDESRLPRPVPSGTAVGRMRESLAASLGLPHGIALVTGGGDQQCAALGSGVLEEGDISIGMGTAANILAASSRCRFEKGCNLITNLAVVPERWFMEGSLIVCGPILTWMRDLLYGKEAETMSSSDLYALLNREAGQDSTPGAHGLTLVPHLQGAGCPYWDDDATGVLDGLTLSTTRADLIRCVMEGMAMEVNKNLRLLLENGIRPQRLVLTGGASRSPVWCQIQADVYGIPVEIPAHPDVAALGSAILAGWACGLFATPAEGVRRIARTARVYTPHPQRHALYSRLTQYHDALYRGAAQARAERNG